MSRKDLDKLEKRILGKITDIQNNGMSPKDSEIDKDLNLMKRLDLPTYEDLMVKYKEVKNERGS